jgi:hypothetical protein
MPKSIKPRMSKDELATFDANVVSIEFDNGEATLTITNKYLDEEVSFCLNERDCDKIVQFIRRNKL